jgi:hypothetical protein
MAAALSGSSPGCNATVAAALLGAAAHVAGCETGPTASASPSDQQGVCNRLHPQINKVCETGPTASATPSDQQGV